MSDANVFEVQNGTYLHYHHTQFGVAKTLPVRL